MSNNILRFLSYKVILCILTLIQSIYATTNIPSSSPSKFADLINAESVWARPSNDKTMNTAVYCTLTNTSENDIKIVGGNSDKISEIFELHNSFIDQQGISRMIKIDHMLIPAKSSINFAPGGLHIMLLKLHNSLKVGDKFNITLAFEDGSNKVVEVVVKAYNTKK